MIAKYINGLSTDVIEEPPYEFYSNNNRPTYAGKTIQNISGYENVYGTICYATY